MIRARALFSRDVHALQGQLSKCGGADRVGTQGSSGGGGGGGGRQAGYTYCS